MNKEAREKLSQFKTAQHSNKENTMSENNTQNSGPQSSGTPTPDSPDQKKEGTQSEGIVAKVKGAFLVVGRSIKTTAVSVYGFAKESLAAAYNGVIKYYNDMKKNIEEKGVARWFADGFRKNAYGFLKFTLKVSAFVLIHNLIMNATGFSILNPVLLLTILVVAIGLSIYSSYKAQKAMGEVSAKTMGSHLVSEMIAA